MRALSRPVRSLVQPLMTPRKALWAEICLNWPSFVGKLAQTTRPSALRFTNPRAPGVLWVEIWECDPFAMSYEAPGILQAVNRYAGRKIVQAVKFSVTTPPPKKRNQAPLPLVTEAHQAQAQEMMSSTEHTSKQLADALTSLGAHLFAHQKR